MPQREALQVPARTCHGASPTLCRFWSEGRERATARQTRTAWEPLAPTPSHKTRLLGSPSPNPKPAQATHLCRFSSEGWKPPPLMELANRSASMLSTAQFGRV